jgi:hypothetical protein
VVPVGSRRRRNSEGEGGEDHGEELHVSKGGYNNKWESG